MSGECDQCGEHTLECLDHERTEIASCELSVRATKLLLKNGIIYVDQLIELSQIDLLQWKSLGRRTLNEIRSFLEKNNISLKDETIRPDVQKMILQDLPRILNKIKIPVDDAIRELRYFSLKLEQISSACTTISEKIQRK